MIMLEVLQQVERNLTEDIRRSQKRRREVRASIIALKAQDLSPVAEEVSGGNNEPFVCRCGHPGAGCSCRSGY